MQYFKPKKYTQPPSQEPSLPGHNKSIASSTSFKQVNPLEQFRPFNEDINLFI